MMLGDHAIKDGELIPSAEAVLPITLREVQCNFSVYEALRVVGGKVVHLPEHLQRLSESARQIRLDIKCSKTQISQWIYKLIQEDHIDRARIRVLVIGGPEGVLFITASEILEYPEAMYNDGVLCTVYEGERFLPECKTSNLLLNYLALEDSKRRGGFEALLLDRDGFIREGTRSNFYGFKNKVLYTAPLEVVLDGITRQAVIKAAEELGIKVIQTAIRYSELDSYDEVFISATSMSAMPVCQIEGIKFSSDHRRTLELSRIVRSRELNEKV